LDANTFLVVVADDLDTLAKDDLLNVVRGERGVRSP